MAGCAGLVLVAACGGDDDDDAQEHADLAAANHGHSDYVTQADLDKLGGSHEHDMAYVNEGQADAISSGMISDGAVSNADVADDAAIAGSKISSNFGDQDILTSGRLGVGVSSVDPAFIAHFSQSGTATSLDYGPISSPAFVVENPGADGMAGPKFPGIIVANFGEGHPYVMQTAAGGTRDAPAASEGSKSIGAWISRAHDGTDFVEAARLSFVAEATFANGHNPTTMRFEIGDDDPATPGVPTRMVIKSSGNIGIGTLDPQATLDVNGFVKLKVNNSPPALCTAQLAGSIALTSQYSLCACNGAAWVFTHTGTSCTF
jgi:hypothetical protein